MIIDPARLAAGWETPLRTVSCPSTTATLLAPANLRRTSLVIFIQPGGTTFYIAPSSGLTTANGLQLNSTTFWREYNFADHGGLVQLPWYGRPSAGTFDMFVWETIWLPDRVPGLRRLLG